MVIRKLEPNVYEMIACTCLLCFQIASEENQAFKAIAHAVLNVPYPGKLKSVINVHVVQSTHFSFCFPGDSVSVSPPALSHLLPEDDTFYQYHGGQTTPPCRQTVTWIVFEKPIFISRKQVNKHKQSKPKNKIHTDN